MPDEFYSTLFDVRDLIKRTEHKDFFQVKLGINSENLWMSLTTFTSIILIRRDVVKMWHQFKLKDQSYWQISKWTRPFIIHVDNTNNVFFLVLYISNGYILETVYLGLKNIIVPSMQLWTRQTIKILIKVIILSFGWIQSKDPRWENICCRKIDDVN